MFLTLAIIPLTPGVTGTLYRLTRGSLATPTEPIAYDLSRDPHPGMAVRIPGVNDSMKEPTALVLAGSCSECAVTDVHDVLAQYRNHRGPLIVMFTTEPTGDLAERLRASGVRCVVDQDGRAHRELNAVFVPRAYLVSARGALLSVQPSPASRPGPTRGALVEAMR